MKHFVEGSLFAILFLFWIDMISLRSQVEHETMLILELYPDLRGVVNLDRPSLPLPCSFSTVLYCLALLDLRIPKSEPFFNPFGQEGMCIIEMDSMK